jgi:hypothetical protein
LDSMTGLPVVWFGGLKLTPKRYVSDASPRAQLICKVYWSESGELVSIATEETFYVLRYSRENYIAAVQVSHSALLLPARS